MTSLAAPCDLAQNHWSLQGSYLSAMQIGGKTERQNKDPCVVLTCYKLSSLFFRPLATRIYLLIARASFGLSKTIQGQSIVCASPPVCQKNILATVPGKTSIQNDPNIFCLGQGLLRSLSNSCAQKQHANKRWKMWEKVRRKRSFEERKHLVNKNLHSARAVLLRHETKTANTRIRRRRRRRRSKCERIGIHL